MVRVHESKYIYMYYVLPDYSAAFDHTNVLIREFLSDKAFNLTLKARVSKPDLLPLLVNIESEDASTTKVPQTDFASAAIATT